MRRADGNNRPYVKLRNKQKRQQDTETGAARFLYRKKQVILIQKRKHLQKRRQYGNQLSRRDT